MNFKYNDGGRRAAGYKGETNDCVCRAVAIATGRDYKVVYRELTKFLKTAGAGSTARSSVPNKLVKKYIESIGFAWVPTMKFGEGCSTHLSQDELPCGTYIVNLSRHVAAVVHGAVNDNHDPRRNGSRCVYGYWIATEKSLAKLEAK
jgi:hypothetical protein